MTFSFVRGPKPKLEIAPLQGQFRRGGEDDWVRNGETGSVADDACRKEGETNDRKAARSYAQKVEDEIREGRLDG